MTTRPGKGADGFMLRLPDGMRERIKKAADANGRTMNAELVAALLERFPDPPDPFEALVQDVLEILERPDPLSAFQDQHEEQPGAGRDALADLLERLRQEVGRRRG